MLNTYLASTRRLLQNPTATSALYADSDLTSYINTARGQVAGEGECIRVLGTMPTVIGQRPYAFSGFALGTPAVTGVQGVIHVRSLQLAVGVGGFRWLTPRPWPWFEFYHLANPVPSNGVPAVWAQYGQGAQAPPLASSASGSFYLDPPPNIVYMLTGDCVCYPIALVDDATIEAIPYFWTDAIPYYAAYMALMASQTGSRTNDASHMLELYNNYVERARKFSNPSLLRAQYEQAGDPVQTAKLGLGKGGK